MRDDRNGQEFAIHIKAIGAAGIVTFTTYFLLVQEKEVVANLL